MSLASATSDAMRDFAEAVYKAGQENPSKKFEDVVEWPTRKVLRAKMVSMTEECIGKSVRRFRDLPFVACAIDEGTTRGKNMLISSCTMFRTHVASIL